MNGAGWPRRVCLAVDDICAAETAPSVKAQRLRELAAWYRRFATRAANPVIWESRLLMAEDLDAEANRIEQRQVCEC
jgi:predicted metalloprotease